MENGIEKTTPDKNQINTLSPKLFREIENKKKLDFVIQNSDINQKIIIKAQKLSNLNGYHNFGNQLWTAESAIRIALVEWLTRKEINLLALVWLFHDAWHWWITTPYDEEKSYELTINSLSEDKLKTLWCTATEIQNLILATKFSLHWKLDWKLEKIIQDADLWCIWYGPYYTLYSTMWLMDEEKISIDDYINEEYKFINHLQKINPDIYLSDWARKIFINPKDSLDIIAKRPKEALLYAYNQRYQDVSFENFSKNIDEIINRLK